MPKSAPRGNFARRPQKYGQIADISPQMPIPTPMPAAFRNQHFRQDIGNLELELELF